jgi:hypothetical protein
MTARRRGGVPPIVTVLITISAVVAAAIAAYFLFSTTSSATKTPMLEVTGAYALCSGTSCTVYITLRNVGTSDVTLSTQNPPQLDVPGVASSISCGTGSSYTVPAGGSINIRCPSSGTTGNVPDGASAALLLTVQPVGSTSTQTLSLAFKIARP